MPKSLQLNSELSLAGCEKCVSQNNPRPMSSAGESYRKHESRVILILTAET